MSTKMYNYRIAKDRWWDFADACRRHYLDNYPIMKALERIAEESKVGPLETFRVLSQAIEIFVGDPQEDWTVDLQLFDEGDTYLIRPCERGYYFLNNHQEVGEQFGLETVFYDDRSDVPPEEEKNKAISEWVDEKIDKREYLVYTVLNREDFRSFAIDGLLRRSSFLVSGSS